jgi:hypothetical protein
VKKYLGIVFSLALSLVSDVALAQFGGLTGGPGPTPNPWTVNGNTVSYSRGGVIVGPANLAGQSKGVGTINVSVGYFINGNSIFNNPLSVFASTTSAQLAGVISDETGGAGGGLAVFSNAPTIISPTITGSFTATGLVGLPSLAVQNPNTILVNPTNANASPVAQAVPSCTGPANALQWLTNTGIQCGVITAAASSVAIGTTSITGGTSTRVMFDNAGVLGEYSISGTGSVAMTTSPVFTTPNIGAATATTVNGNAITAGSGTLTLAAGKTLTANNSISIAGTDGKTITVSNSIGLAGTDGTAFTFPSASDTVVGLAAAQTLANKTLTAPILTNPQLGTATATSVAIGGCAIGANALCANGTISITSTSQFALAVGLNGATNPALQVDASTASSATGVSIKSAAAGANAQISAISSAANEGLTINAKGTGSVAFGNVSTGPILILAPLQYGGVVFNNATTGSGNLVGSVSPTFSTSITVPQIFGGSGAGSALSLASTSNVSPSGDVVNLFGSTINLRNIQNSGTSVVNIGNANATSGQLTIAGASSGALSIVPTPAASGTITLPNGPDTLVGLAATQTLTNKTLTSPTISNPNITGHPTIEGVTSAGATGTGNFVFSANPLIGNLTVSAAFTATGLVTFADMASAAIATQANVISGATGVLVPASSIYTSETLTSFGTTTTFDFSTFINTAVTLTGNITTMTLANVKAGQSGQIRFIQDGTGSRTTVWNSIFKFPNGVTPLLTPGPSSVDALEYSCVSASYCVASLVQNVH